MTFLRGPMAAHRVARLAAPVVALALLAAACGSSGTGNSTGTTTPSGGGGNNNTPLVIARDMDLNSLDPARAYCDTCQIYLSAIYETLVGLAPDNKTLVPRLASSWSSNADNTVYTFHLNPAAKFSDGTPVTSKDVKFSWLRLKYVNGSAAYLMLLVKSIATPDPQTVVVSLSQPSSEFLNETNASYTGIVNSTVAIANGATDAANASTKDTAEKWFLAHSAGSGPYMLQSYTPGAEVDFTKNPNYWGTPPAITRVILKQVGNAVTQGQLLQSGAADIAMQIDPITSKTLQGQSGITVNKIPSFNFLWLGLSPGTTANTEVPLDAKIRQAIRLSIDYQGLVNVLLGGAGTLQGAPIPNGFAGSAGLPLTTPDLTQAKQLLAQDGHPNGVKITAIFPSLNVYGVDFSTAMQLVQSDLAKVGIHLTLHPVTFSVLLDDQTKGVLPFTMVYFAPDYFGSAQYLNFFGLVPGSNWSVYAGGKPTNKPIVNQAEGATFQQALAAKDQAQRESLYHQLGLDMISDNVVIPLLSPDLVLAYRSSVQGVTYSACCNLEIWNLSRK
jgi:peptide/nickel transport system substrate-binding protein